MLRLAADENLDIRLVQGLLRRNSTLDILRVQEAGLAGAPDEVVLAWAALGGLRQQPVEHVYQARVEVHRRAGEKVSGQLRLHSCLLLRDHRFSTLTSSTSTWREILPVVPKYFMAAARKPAAASPSR